MPIKAGVELFPSRAMRIFLGIFILLRSVQGSRAILELRAMSRAMRSFFWWHFGGGKEKKFFASFFPLFV